MITEENSPNVLILGKNDGLNLKTEFENLATKKGEADIIPTSPFYLEPQKLR